MTSILVGACGGWFGRSSTSIPTSSASFQPSCEARMTIRDGVMSGRFVTRRVIRPKSWSAPETTIRLIVCVCIDAVSAIARRCPLLPRRSSAISSQSSLSCCPIWFGLIWSDCQRLLRERTGGARRSVIVALLGSSPGAAVVRHQQLRLDRTPCARLVLRQVEGGGLRLPGVENRLHQRPGGIDLV